jgi:hypothetical protein
MKKAFSEKERVKFFKQFSLTEWKMLNRVPRFLRALRKKDLIVAGEIASEALRGNNLVHKHQTQIENINQIKLQV